MPVAAPAFVVLNPVAPVQSSDGRLARLERELAELRRLVQALASRVPADQAPAGVVLLAEFAASVGKAPKTIANDLTSGDPCRRQRWPVFTKAGGGWVTTGDEVRRWLAAGRSTGLAPEVAAALADVRSASRRGRTRR